MSRETVFCCLNPYKELNPPKHQKKRLFNQINIQAESIQIKPNQKKHYENNKNNINVIVQPPLKPFEHKGKACGLYYQNQNASSAQSLREGSQNRRKISYNSNKETITTELTDQTNYYYAIQQQGKRKIPQKSQIQECFNQVQNRQMRSTTQDNYIHYKNKHAIPQIRTNAYYKIGQSNNQSFYL